MSAAVRDPKFDPERVLATFIGMEYHEASGQFTHNLRTAVVNPDGTVHSVYRGNDWSPAEVVQDLRSAAALER